MESINYDSSKQRLRTLLRKLENERLGIPDYQRDFVWSLRQQKRLIEAVRRGKPIPSLLLRNLEDEDDSTTLEDGHQRLRTLQRFVRNEFSVDGRFYSDLTEDEKKKILDYELIIVTYSGATDEVAREIFNDFQNGKPLTFGERLSAAASPIVEFATQQLLTPGQGYYERMERLFGAGRTTKGRRGSDMAMAFALCAGLAFGIDHLSKKWDDAESVLHREFNEERLQQKLERYISVWERVNEIAPITTKARRNEYWNLGTFGGYIVYSFEIYGTADAAAYALPATEQGLVEMWAQHIVDCYHDETLLVRTLHRDLSAARSWKLARWANGLHRLTTPDNPIVMEDDDDDDDASM
jgi:hypothetical protein